MQGLDNVPWQPRHLNDHLDRLLKTEELAGDRKFFFFPSFFQPFFQPPLFRPMHLGGDVAPQLLS